MVGRTIRAVVFIPLGILLYIFSGEFRSLVKVKMHRTREPVATGEVVIAVIEHDGEKKVIGG